MKNNCPCGKELKIYKSQKGRKKYCCKKCFYKYRSRPIGLKYNIKSTNKAWFKKGNVPFYAGKKLPFEVWNKGKGKYLRKKNIHGYWIIYKPHHEMADKDGYVLEHRYIIEEHIGRILGSQECVHHIDLSRDNNDINNLMLITRREHTLLHNNLKNAKTF